MATLTGQTVQARFKDLIQVSNANSGIDATKRDVEDGEGTASVLQLSTTAANVKSGFELNGTSAQTGALLKHEVGGLETDISAITDGDFIVGTGSGTLGLESGATVRTSLGLVIGTDVQAYDAGLADIAGLAVSDGNFIVGNGSNWVAESDATARASLGLVIGTDVPQLGANTFTADQTIQSTDAGASVGPQLILHRDSASPANGDLIGALLFDGEDSADNQETYAVIRGVIDDATTTSEDAQIAFLTVKAGSLATRLRLGNGLFTDGAIGGDQGVNTVNSSGFYVDGVLIDPASQAEQETGTDTTITAIVTSGTQHFHNSAAKGWADFNTAGSANSSYNVSSITDGGAGSATVNWTTSFSSGNYPALATIFDTSDKFAQVGGRSTGSVAIRSVDVSAGTLSDPSVGYNVVAFGDL